MSFWEEFGQKITQESQKAIRKTRDMASVVTMNADISESKRKINELYQELGQLVVKEAFAGVTADQLQSALMEENADEQMREIRLTNWQDIYSKVMFIRSEEEVIALNESKINQLKSESRCPGCGRPINGSMTFCPMCGTRLQQEAAAPNAAAPAEPAAPNAVAPAEPAAPYAAAPAEPAAPAKEPAPVETAPVEAAAPSEEPATIKIEYVEPAEPAAPAKEAGPAETAPVEPAAPVEEPAPVPEKEETPAE